MDDTQAALDIITAIAEAIRDIGSVPSGHLYATVMGHMSLQTYESIINMLVRSNLVRRDGNHLLTWIGPKES